SLIVAVVPKPPARHLRDGDDDEEEEELILVTGFLIILLNLGKKQHGDLRYAIDWTEISGLVSFDLFGTLPPLKARVHEKNLHISYVPSVWF
ncbi:hypothetical protein B296_00033668, partial [Ensete ventricosum]